MIRKPIPKTNLEEYIKKIAPLKHAFDLINDHVIVTDENANILYANKAVETKTGYSISEIIGKNPGDLWGGQMEKELYKEMWHTIKEEKKPFAGEVKNKRKSGEDYWQELHISPVLDEKGEIRFFIGIEPDITDRKKKEQFREEFLSVIGHQAMTPNVTGIHWILEWMLGSGKLTKTQYEMLRRVYKQNEGLIALLGDLLFLARVGEGYPTREHTDLAHVIEAIIKEVREKHPFISLLYENRLKSSVSFYTHRSAVTQLFSNIITNAAEYVDQSSGSVEVMLDDSEDAYIFSCRDNGIGIPLEEQGKIFSRFFRASNASGAKGTGTGLGLYIVKVIADNFGWRVYFESKVGEGTVFYIHIPHNWRMRS
ncbi:MAG: PAS domain S-box protein [Candidatus Portnoybacteria bacterium]|nr:PAS domain S-box protein [Candidatus Portnoybacteria bacterium]